MKQYSRQFFGLLIISIAPVLAALSYCPGIYNFPVLSTIASLSLSVFNIYYYFVAGVLLLSIIVQIIKKNHLGSAVLTSLFLFAFTVLFLFFQYTASSIAASRETRLNSSIRVVSANVHLNSTLDQKLAEYIREKNADVVVLLEVSPIHIKDIDEFFKEYSYRKIIPQNNAFGLAVLSKYPATFNVHEIEGIPYIKAQVLTKETNFDIYAVHTIPPMIPKFTSTRKAQIDTILSITTVNSVVIGDFNALAHDPVFQHKPVHLVPLKLATWPDWGLKIFGIGIDHAFLSKGLKYKYAEVGPRTNSDHYPIYVEVGK